LAHKTTDTYDNVGLKKKYPEKIKYFIFDKEGIDLPIPIEKCSCNLVPMEKLVNVVDMPAGNAIQSCLVLGSPTEHMNEKIDNEFVVWKASVRECSKISNLKWNTYMDVFDCCIKVKNNVFRGLNNDGICNSYFCFGFRKNPKNSEIGKYSFGGKCEETAVQQIEDNIAKLVGDLEKVTQSFFSNLSVAKNYQKIKEQFSIPTITDSNVGLATQFSVSKDYWSQVHVDEDYMFTSLSCCCRDSESREAILYNFCFPTYNLRVPLRHGDVIVFDPAIPHSCSNPSGLNCYIMSSYVSQKTVNTQISHVINSAK
jgi:hypothetical protein